MPNKCFRFFAGNAAKITPAMLPSISKSRKSVLLPVITKIQIITVYEHYGDEEGNPARITSPSGTRRLLRQAWPPPSPRFGISQELAVDFPSRYPAGAAVGVQFRL